MCCAVSCAMEGAGAAALSAVWRACTACRPGCRAPAAPSLERYTAATCRSCCFPRFASSTAQSWLALLHRPAQGSHFAQADPYPAQAGIFWHRCPAQAGGFWHRLPSLLLGRLGGGRYGAFFVLWCFSMHACACASANCGGLVIWGDRTPYPACWVEHGAPGALSVCTLRVRARNNAEVFVCSKWWRPVHQVPCCAALTFVSSYIATRQYVQSALMVRTNVPQRLDGAQARR